MAPSPSGPLALSPRPSSGPRHYLPRTLSGHHAPSPLSLSLTLAHSHSRPLTSSPPRTLNPSAATFAPRPLAPSAQRTFDPSTPHFLAPSHCVAPWPPRPWHPPPLALSPRPSSGPPHSRPRTLSGHHAPSPLTLSLLPSNLAPLPAALEKYEPGPVKKMSVARLLVFFNPLPHTVV